MIEDMSWKARDILVQQKYPAIYNKAFKWKVKESRLHIDFNINDSRETCRNIAFHFVSDR